MHTAKVTLESESPYSQSRMHDTPKNDRESGGDYEERTWRERAHFTEDGKIFIPPMVFKNCLDEAGKYLGMKIKGKGKSTYTKHFESGVMVLEGALLVDKKGQQYTKDTCNGNPLFMNADGKRGSSTRVKRTYPIFHEWKAEVTFHVLDDTITKDVFMEHLKVAGQFIGIGQFRPKCRGYFGRFTVKNIKWE